MEQFPNWFFQVGQFATLVVIGWVVVMLLISALDGCSRSPNDHQEKEKDNDQQI